MLLAIDSSAGTSVAIVDQGQVVVEANSFDSRGHAESIGLLIKECLTKAGTTPNGIEAIAVGMGPGPFTGLRVGIAAANSYGLALKLPVYRLPSHAAIAFSEFAQGSDKRLLVTADAKRRQRYWTLFERAADPSVPIAIRGPEISDEAQISATLIEAGEPRRIDSESVSAGSLGLLAESMLQSGASFLGPAPLYLRSPDVTVAKSAKRVSQ